MSEDMNNDPSENEQDVKLEETDEIYDLIVLGIIKQWRDSARASLEKQAKDLAYLSQVVDESNEYGE